MSFQQYNITPWLTPVRTVATANLAGTYFNGQTNNGVGATLTIAASSLTVDSVVMAVGDRLLLIGQTNAFENGIYVVLSIGSVVVLQRAADQQNIEQYHIGQYVTVGAGTLNAGTAYVNVEPLPAILGINGLVWSSLVAAGAVAFSGPASTANALAVFSDTAGNIKAQSVASTLGFGLTISTGNLAVSAGTITSSGTITTSAGNLVVTAGTITSSGAIQSLTSNVTAGSSGNAGTHISFPATAANGVLILAAANAGGAFNTTISNGTMGQSTVYTLPDILAATGGIVVSTAAVRMKSVAAAAAAGGAAAQSFTDAFSTTGSNIIGNWNTQTNPASVLKIVPGNGSFVVTSSADAGVGTFNYIIMK